MNFARSFAFIFALAFSAAAPQTALARGEAVALSGYAPGTIVVMTSERRLYFVTAQGRAVRYPVGVGRAGKAWAGHAFVAEKFIRPAWMPPADVRRDNPGLPSLIPGGAPNNPMGAAVLSLNVNDYAIHGTNNPGSVGGFVSYGCIRMYNEDVLELYRMVRPGTPVVVLR